METGELYSIESTELLDDIRKAYRLFIKKYGYAPEFIEIRARHCTSSKLKRSAIQKIGMKDVIVVTKNFPLHHFFLFPIVPYRQPKVLKVRRMPL